MAAEKVNGSLFQKINGVIKQMHPETNAAQVNVASYNEKTDQRLNVVIADIEKRLKDRENIDVFQFKGGVDQTTGLPDKDYSIGWTYRVAEAGTYAGNACELGDTIYCKATNGDNDDWLVIQANIDGAVTGPVSAVNENITVFDGATGTVVKDSGIAISKIGDIETDLETLQEEVTTYKTENDERVKAVEDDLAQYKTDTDARLDIIEPDLEELKKKKYIVTADSDSDDDLQAAATDLVDGGLIFVKAAAPVVPGA